MEYFFIFFEDSHIYVIVSKKSKKGFCFLAESLFSIRCGNSELLFITDGKFIYTSLEELTDFLVSHISNDKWPPKQAPAFFEAQLPKPTIGNRQQNELYNKGWHLKKVITAVRQQHLFKKNL